MKFAEGKVSITHMGIHNMKMDELGQSIQNPSPTENRGALSPLLEHSHKKVIIIFTLCVH